MSHSSPIVSIIVPVYNTVRELPRCLNSLLRQTLKQIEIVCVDDGSTDGSSEIIRNYAKRDVRIVPIFLDNGGVERARAHALRVVHGQYIMFCDSDDAFEPDACRQMVERLEADDVDWVMCGTKCKGPFTSNERDSYHVKAITRGHSQSINPGFVLWNKIYRKSVLDRKGLTFPESPLIRRGFDAYFVLLYSLVADSASVIEAPLVIHYRRKGSLQHRVKTGTLPSSLDAIYAIPFVLTVLDVNGLFKPFSNRFFRAVEVQLVASFSNGKEAEFNKGIRIFREYLSVRTSDIPVDSIWTRKVLLEGDNGVKQFRIWTTANRRRIRENEDRRTTEWLLEPIHGMKQQILRLARKIKRFLKRILNFA